jgi:hypothetical protein
MAQIRTQAGTRWVVGNSRVRLVLAAAEGGGLAELMDLETGRDFIAGAPAPLYRLTLAQQRQDPIELTSVEAESVEASRSISPAGETLTLAYGPHRGLDIRVTCTIWLAAHSPLSEWRIAVKNGTSYGIRAIRYPVVIAPSILGDSGDDDCFIWGHFGGEIIERPREKLNQLLHLGGHSWCRSQQYPGPVAVQMQAYYDRTAGLYIATYDDAGHVKAFGLRSNGETFDLSVEHNYDERPGLSFELPYTTILGVFHGNWYTAANIYKEWARHQHWCARRLTERGDIPAWAKEPRPSLAVASRGNIERFRGTLNSPPAEWPLPLYWPASKVVPRIQKYAELFRSPVITWMEGWEQIGAPGGPVDIFPPYEGEESFRAAMSELNLAVSLVFMVAETAGRSDALFKY